MIEVLRAVNYPVSLLEWSLVLRTYSYFSLLVLLDDCYLGFWFLPLQYISSGWLFLNKSLFVTYQKKKKRKDLVEHCSLRAVCNSPWAKRIFTCLIWSLWRERNSQTFNKKQLTVLELKSNFLISLIEWSQTISISDLKNVSTYPKKKKKDLKTSTDFIDILSM